MLRRALCVLPMLALSGCGLPSRLRASSDAGRSSTASRRARPVSLSERVRQEGWMTRFWEQLTPGQRRRVLRRLQRSDPPLAGTEDEAAPIWDALGLPDRNELVFGAGLARRD